MVRRVEAEEVRLRRRSAGWSLHWWLSRRLMRCAWLMLPSKKTISASGMAERVAGSGNWRVVTLGAPACSHLMTLSSGGTGGPGRKIILVP